MWLPLVVVTVVVAAVVESASEDAEAVDTINDEGADEEGADEETSSSKVEEEPSGADGGADGSTDGRAEREGEDSTVDADAVDVDADAVDNDETKTSRPLLDSGLVLTAWDLVLRQRQRLDINGARRSKRINIARGLARPIAIFCAPFIPC
jgi:hypothetical protein